MKALLVAAPLGSLLVRAQVTAPLMEALLVEAFLVGALLVGALLVGALLMGALLMEALFMEALLREQMLYSVASSNSFHLPSLTARCMATSTRSGRSSHSLQQGDLWVRFISK